MEIALLSIQFAQLIFLVIHDWIPLGRFNDLAGVRQVNTTKELIVVTLIGAVPVIASIVLTLIYFNAPMPIWALGWMWGTYGLLLLGAIRAWWIPYLIREDAARANRFRIMFGNTHSFLPLRNGMAPNTLHFAFHISVVATLLMLLLKGST